MYVCGCKLTSSAPFCDGVTCQKILKGEEFELKEDMLYLEEEDVEEVEEGEEELPLVDEAEKKDNLEK